MESVVESVVEHPDWIPFSKGETQAIEKAVANAEQKTSGEIVVAVAHSSHPWNGLTFNVILVSLIPFYVGLFLIWLGQPGFGLPELGAMSDDLPEGVLGGLNIPLLTLGIALCLGATFFVFWGRRSTLCLRKLTPKRDLQLLTEMRAEIEFFEAGLNKTEGRTGILLYVSLAEHRAVVLADKGIDKKVDEETWKQIVDRLVAAAKSDDLAKGITDAVDSCVEILAKEFPPVQHNPDEVSNRVRFLEPLL